MKMEKFWKNNKAGVAPLVGLGIVIIIVVVALIFYSTSGSEYWESEAWDDATWGQDVVLEYEDGTLQALKPAFDDPTLAMTHQGKFVVAIHYILKGKASGDSGTVEIEVSEFRYAFELEQVGAVKWSRTHNPSLLLPNNIIPMDIDDTWHDVFYRPHTVTELNAINVDDGTYTLWLKPQGALKYRASGTSTWNDATLPSEVAFTVTMSGSGGEGGGNLIVSFDSGYKVYTTN